MRARWRDFTAGAVIVIAVIWCGAYNPWHTESDPDRYYHLTIDRLTVESGSLVHELPQPDDLGWSKQFYEKEFLFHAFTAIGYLCDGEHGAIFSVWLMCAALFILIYTAARFYAPPEIALFLCALLLFFDRQFMRRMLFVRPYVLALVFFFALLIALQRKQPRWVFVACFGFALAYHAHYLIFLALGLAWFFQRDARALGAGLLGLGIGLLINPYFPTNVVLAFTHVFVALGTHALDKTELALELMPYDTWTFFEYFGAHLFLLVFAFVLARQRALSWQTRFLLALTAAFFLLGFRSPRALEYAAPLAVVLAAWIFSEIPQRTFTYAAVAATLLLLPRGIKDLSGDQIPEIGLAKDKLASAFAIPDRPGKKVFNCDWASGAFVFYARPDMREVDLIEPVLLLEHAPEKFDARVALQNGDVVDAEGLIHGAFASDFVYCRNEKIVAQLDKDPAFARLYPADRSLDAQKFPAVFAVGSDPAFVRHILAGDTLANAQNVLSLPPARDGTPREETLQENPPVFARYFDFHGSDHSAKEGIVCTTARPTREEMQAHLGADLVSIGGGPDSRLWLNGAPLAAAPAPEGQARLMHTLIALPHPLGDKDDLAVVTCAQASSPYAGLALGLWHKSDLQSLCDKRDPAPWQDDLAAHYPLHADSAERCWGTISLNAEGAARSSVDPLR